MRPTAGPLHTMRALGRTETSHIPLNCFADLYKFHVDVFVNLNGSQDKFQIKTSHINSENVRCAIPGSNSRPQYGLWSKITENEWLTQYTALVHRYKITKTTPKLRIFKVSNNVRNQHSAELLIIVDAVSNRHANRPTPDVRGRNGTLMTIMKGRGANRPLASYIYISFRCLLGIIWDLCLA